VHFVTQIGNDRGKRRQASIANVGQDLAERHDSLELRRRQVATKVDEGLIGIKSSGSSRRGEGVGQTSAVDDAIDAVAAVAVNPSSSRRDRR